MTPPAPTAEALAALHAAAFTHPRPWTAAEFAALLADPTVFVLPESQGALLGRSVADEAELLTLAVWPMARRQGQGDALVARFLSTAQARGAARAFLEVAEPNLAARALYARHGFAEAGRRRGYYTDGTGGRIDALVLTRPL